MKKYSELLRDPRWQKKRLQIMERDEFTCQECYDDTRTLNVHHLGYTKGNMPWEYPDGLLITLCENCHTYETENLLLAKRRLSDMFALKGMRADTMKHFSVILSRIDDGFFNNPVRSSILEFFLENKDAWNTVHDMFCDDIRQRHSQKDGGEK